jgi:hypothetical protein
MERICRRVRRGLDRMSVQVLAVGLLAVAMPALAQGPGWTGNSTVIALVVTTAGAINVRLSPELTGCVAQSGYGSSFASILPTHPGLKEMKADLLSALHTGTNVRLWLSDANCTIGEMSIGAY